MYRVLTHLDFYFAAKTKFYQTKKLKNYGKCIFRNRSDHGSQRAGIGYH